MYINETPYNGYLWWRSKIGIGDGRNMGINRSNKRKFEAGQN